MDWKELNSAEELERIVEISHEHPVLIFKHSTRCGISSMAFDRLRRNQDDLEKENIKVFVVDVVGNRSISNAIQEKFNVWHESPQAILIRNGRVVYHDSHMGIYFESIREAVRD